MLRIFLAAATAPSLTLMLAMLVIALLAPAAHAGERRDGDRQERSWPERPHYAPSWERTQRRYLPSYQYELERRRICGNYCDDIPRRYRDDE